MRNRLELGHAPILLPAIIWLVFLAPAMPILSIAPSRIQPNCKSFLAVLKRPPFTEVANTTTPLQ